MAREIASRRVAIELMTWRSGRIGGSAGSITGGKTRFLGSVEDTCKSSHGVGEDDARARLVISPTMPRLARPAILA
jgi:hypothetical protein